MYEESIEELNKWFDSEDNNHSFYTSRNSDGEYTVEQSDIDEFCDYLRENETDLIYIPCKVGTDGIWFNREDLENAKYL